MRHLTQIKHTLHVYFLFAQHNTEHRYREIREKHLEAIIQDTLLTENPNY